MTSSPAPTHRAPPADRRPRSPLGTWALVVSLGMCGVAWIFDGVWPFAAVGLLFSVWAALRIRPREERGQGLALFGVVVSLAFGGLLYGASTTWRDVLGHVGGGVLAALDEGGTEAEAGERVAPWLEARAANAGAADRLVQRYAAVKEAVGPYAGTLDLGSSFLGLWPVRRAPRVEAEIGQGIGDPWTPRPSSFWIRAKFRDGDLQVELVPADLDGAALQKAMELREKGEPTPMLADVRFFKTD